MKNGFLWYIFIVYSVFAGYGQSFPTDSAYWKTEYGSVTCVDLHGVSDICWEKQYFLQDDTIIGGQLYNKIICSGRTRDPITNTWTYFYEGYKGAIRSEEASKKVFYKPSSSAEQLLYDFDLHVGDQLPASYVYDPYFAGIIIVDQIDTVHIDDKDIVRYHMDNAGFGGEYILEGIGSTLGLLEPITPWFEQHFGLLCFKNYETSLVYPDPGYCNIITDAECLSAKSRPPFTVLPNPVSDQLVIQVQDMYEDKYTIQIADMLGKILDECVMQENPFRLNFTSYDPGIYSIYLFGEKRIIGTKKIIKHR
jgi:hypothetical protein